jgi:threonine dehydrogenase-like Zn-dependent dehydrogenase
MRALNLHNAQLHYQTDVTMPQPQGDEVLLKIRRAGICNTDLELLRGYKGFQGILGHEFVAEVVGGSPELAGKRVVGEINVACRQPDCEMCRRGIPSQCPHRTTVGISKRDGAFADYMTLPRPNLYVVPDSVSDEEAVFVEPLAAALQILEAVQITPRDRVILNGAGKLGLLAAQVLKLTGANLQVIVRREKQAALLRQWEIATITRDRVPDRSADVVVDCTGVPDGFAQALDMLKPRGTLVLKSTYQGLPQANLTRVVVDEIRVIGSRCGPFEAALRLLGNKLVDVEALIEACYPLDKGLNAFEHAMQPGTLKVLLAMS